MRWPGAVCPSTDPEVFFPEKNGSAQSARKVCRRCPAKEPCLQYALADPSLSGVWGGATERERRALRRARDSRGVEAA